MIAQPYVGSAVWWAPKRVGCVITAIRDTLVTFQGGEIIRNRRGREVPRWTVQVEVKHLRWDAELGMFFVGRGPKPRTQGGIVLTPEPLALSGTTRGSFAPHSGR